ncbi:MULTISPECIES: fimbria/pilus outer membrane usher protein [Anaeromyxobacter]|uniref:fimbria/pilus outer membrane usher protein n=1 Tax=Anaeromyxobacter TaxID=161492 RepID=UPI001F56B341|nr:MULTISPECIES: fimbria/pilus outer membrane usher protein [unclassified Anaeromyxobacter]
MIRKKLARALALVAAAAAAAALATTSTPTSTKTAAPISTSTPTPTATPTPTPTPNPAPPSTATPTAALPLASAEQLDLTSPPAAAAPRDLSAAEGDLRPAFLQLFVNGGPADTALVLVAPQDIWIAPADLVRAGLAGFGGARRELDGRTLVSLRSLAPGVRFDLDERALAIRLEAAPSLLGHGALDLRASSRPAGLETGDAPSAFLNYAGRATTQEDVSGFLEAGVSHGSALLAGSVSATRAAGAVRGLTTLTIDRPARLLRLTAGDAAIPPDALSGAPLVGGVGLARELSLDPYLARTPLPGATAFAATPSTIDVYVNGALARTLTVAPGTYDLSNLPVSTGANDVRIVVRDAFGRTQAIEAAHYQAQGLLAPGLDEPGLWVGAVRERFGTESFAYGDPILVARERRGFTRAFTGGARLELGPRVQQGGASAALGVGSSELELAGAASADEGTPGAAAFLAWRHVARRFALGADASLLSTRYANSTLSAAADRALWRAGAYATAPLGRGASLQLQYVGAEQRDAGASHRVDVRTSLRVRAGAWLLLSASVTRDRAAEAAGAVFAQLVLSAPGGGTLDAGVRSSRAGASASTGLSRSVPVGPGVGYQLRADSAAGGAVSGLLQAQPEFGHYELGYARVDGSEAGSASASGALVLVGGRLFATRPVEQGFALVRVPGVGGVRAYLDRRPVGRTDGRGDLLVPGLLPYYGNRLGIEDADVPQSYRVGLTERLVAARPRGAALVRFDVTRLRAVEGWLRIARRDRADVPAYGTFEVDVAGGTRRSPVGADGAFWLEDVPAGAHAARIYWKGELCELPLEIPDSGTGVLELGTITCGAREPML